MRDDFQFAAVAAVSLAAIAGYVVLAITDSDAAGFHDVVLGLVTGLLGFAGGKAVGK